MSISDKGYISDNCYSLLFYFLFVSIIKNILKMFFRIPKGFWFLRNLSYWFLSKISVLSLNFNDCPAILIIISICNKDSVFNISRKYDFNVFYVSYSECCQEFWQRVNFSENFDTPFVHLLLKIKTFPKLARVGTIVQNVDF